MTWKILAICGSFGQASSNLKLLQKVAYLAPESVEIIYFDGLRDLPLFSPDSGEISPLPQPVQHWKRALATCDAVLIASPEYGHSVPGGLKNGLDWVFASGEFQKKIVVITAATIRPEQGLRGLAALRQTLEAAEAQVMSDSPIIQDENVDQKIHELLEILTESLTFYLPSSSRND